MCRNLGKLLIFSFHFKGAQGETGSKGERGDPGLPVSLHIHIYIHNRLSDGLRYLLLFRVRTEFRVKKDLGVKRVAKVIQDRLENVVARATEVTRVNKEYRDWMPRVRWVQTGYHCPVVAGDHQRYSIYILV